MKTNEITDGNRILAEFMTGRPKSSKVFFDLNCVASDLKYYTSWDWLMPVVEKIESLVFPNDVYYNFNILGGCQVYIISSDIDEFGSYSEPTKLLTVFKACVEFVKWLNEQQ